ncbi:hypothetical protein ACU686_23430 [Yinghuangia aomiensis]
MDGPGGFEQERLRWSRRPATVAGGRHQAAELDKAAAEAKQVACWPRPPRAGLPAEDAWSAELEVQRREQQLQADVRKPRRR